MRHNFDIRRSKNALAPDAVRTAMHHLPPKLTMNVCTEPILLDVGGVLEAYEAVTVFTSTPQSPICPLLAIRLANRF
jgi:hypothetical protein